MQVKCDVTSCYFVSLRSAVKLPKKLHLCARLYNISTLFRLAHRLKNFNFCLETAGVGNQAAVESGAKNIG